MVSTLLSLLRGVEVLEIVLDLGECAPHVGQRHVDLGQPLAGGVEVLELDGDAKLGTGEHGIFELVDGHLQVVVFGDQVHQDFGIGDKFTHFLNDFDIKQKTPIRVSRFIQQTFAGITATASVGVRYFVRL